MFWAELGYLAYLTYQILKSERVKGKIDNFSQFYYCAYNCEQKHRPKIV